MVIMTSLAVTRERERGTMENLLAMPVTPLEVMIGKLLPFIGVGLFQVTIIVGAALVLFGVPMLGSLAALAAVLVVHRRQPRPGLPVQHAGQEPAPGDADVDLLLPALDPDERFHVPVQGMPQWAQVIGEVLPLTHFLRIVRGVMLKGNGFAEAWPNLWPLVLFLLAVATLAVARYQRTLD